MPAAHWRPLIVPDATEVYYATRSLVENGNCKITVNGMLHPPRYSYGYTTFLLAPLYWLFGRPEAMFVVPMICGILNMVLMYKLTKLLFGPKAAVISALLVPLLPSYFAASWDLLSHVPSLTLFLLIAVLAQSACAGPTPGFLSALAIGVLGGVAITIRPTSVLFLVPALVTLICCPGLIRRQRWLRGAAIIAGAAPLVLPLLWHNLKTFGACTRTGYSYWCAVLYDLPRVVFRFDLATLREAVAFYYVPIAPNLGLLEFRGLSLVVLGVFASLVIISFLRAWRETPASRQYAVFTLSTLVAFHLVYLPYTFRYHWFAYPAYASLMPFLARGLGCLWPGLEVGPRADRRRAVCLIVLLFLCLIGRRYIPAASEEPREWAWAQYYRLHRQLPDDAVFISDRDPLSVHEELVRVARRDFVPRDRKTHYANLQITPRPPLARTASAVAAASRPVYPAVFEEEPAQFLHRYAGRRVILETREPDTVRRLLPPGFHLVPFESRWNLSLYELKPG
jgi:hypothetical protein